MKINGLRLYYQILKLHSKKLKGRMRQLGDLYVKQEFRLNHEKSTDEQYKIFYNAWLQYYDQLRQVRRAEEMARQINKEDYAKMSEEQQENFKKLEK